MCHAVYWRIRACVFVTTKNVPGIHFEHVRMVMPKFCASPAHTVIYYISQKPIAPRRPGRGGQQPKPSPDSDLFPSLPGVKSALATSTMDAPHYEFACQFAFAFVFMIYLTSRCTGGRDTRSPPPSPYRPPPPKTRPVPPKEKKRPISPQVRVRPCRELSASVTALWVYSLAASEDV